jgi:TRAP-type C4-dicarboxylate transport system permease small subunit
MRAGTLRQIARVVHILVYPPRKLAQKSKKRLRFPFFLASLFRKAVLGLVHKHLRGKKVDLYKKIVNGICLAFEVFAALSLAGMVLIVAGNVISRYFFSVTPGWTEETARLLMIQFCFIAMAMGARDKIHIALTAIVDRLPKKVILPIEIAGKFLTGVLGIMICGFMWVYILKLPDNRLPGTGLPVGWSYLIPTLTGGILSLISIYQIYDHVKFGTDAEQRKEGDFSKELSTL